MIWPTPFLVNCAETYPLSCLKNVLIVVLLASSGLAAELGQLTADQAKVLESARAAAMQYTKLLPDFICTQITHRSTSNILNSTTSLGAGISGRSPVAGMANSPHYSNDVIEEQLTFANGKERYDVLKVNGKKASGEDHMLLAGAISAGEFGSALEEVFDPRSNSAFTWDREENRHGRHEWVFNFHVPKEAGTTIVYRNSDREISVSYSGRIFIDPVTYEVLEISSRYDLPLDFPIKLVERTVEYAPREIAGKSYMLPTRSLVHLEDGTTVYDNRIDFKDYHHFASESTIHFNNDNQQQ